jgi:hypothetical protein
MRRVVKLVAAQLRRVYFRLARPLVNLLREERRCEHKKIQEELAAACAAVGAEATRLARVRQELLDQVRADRSSVLEQARVELEKVRNEVRNDRRLLREEMERMNQGLVEYHAVLTQKVADELTKMNRRLETPARAA